MRAMKTLFSLLAALASAFVITTGGASDGGIGAATGAFATGTVWATQADHGGPCTGSPY
jgi:hypothetical protein